jgi:secondary thiamine-phosphate synthase enzyme
VKKLTIETTRKVQLIDITALVRDTIESSDVGALACLVYSPHTTVGITINEHADPAVAEDMIAALEEIVPEDRPWRHREGNSPAHVKASLVGSSALVSLEDGRLALGTWQGVFLCEFDGPRIREVWLKLLG